MIRIHLFGPMRVLGPDGADIRPQGRRSVALLGVLALACPKPVLRGWLTQLLCGDREEQAARAYIRQDLHRVRAALFTVPHPILQAERDHVALLAGTLWIDVHAVPPPPPSDLGGELMDDLDGISPAFDTWLAEARDQFRPP